MQAHFSWLLEEITGPRAAPTTDEHFKRIGTKSRRKKPCLTGDALPGEFVGRCLGGPIQQPHFGNSWAPKQLREAIVVAEEIQRPQ